MVKTLWNNKINVSGPSVVFEATETVKTLDDALEQCERNGGELATPESEEDFERFNDEVRKLDIMPKPTNESMVFLLVGMKDLENNPTKLTYLNG